MSGHMYKIGEAAQLLNLKSYVLRFWETEFPQLNPTRTEKGQRLYTDTDLELLKKIQHLLHDRGLTIEGARKVLSSRSYNQEAIGYVPESNPREVTEEQQSHFRADEAINASIDARKLELASKKALLQQTLNELKQMRKLLADFDSRHP